MEEPLNQTKIVLTQSAAEKVVRRYGIPFARGKLAKSENEAHEIARKLGFPLVMKISSPDVVHKTESGGVILGVDSYARLRESYVRLVKNFKKKEATV